MNKKEISRLLTGISATHPNLKVDNIEPMVESWHTLIGDIDYDLAQKAVIIILRTSEYPTFPTPGAIRAAAIDLSCRMPSEDEVLQEILDRLHYHHREHPPLSLIAQKVSEALGWDYMGGSEEPGVLRGQIRGLYRSCAERIERDIVMVPLGSGKPLRELMAGDQKRIKALTARIGLPTRRQGT